MQQDWEQLLGEWGGGDNLVREEKGRWGGGGEERTVNVGNHGL